MVVGRWKEFYQDFAYNAYSWFHFIGNGKTVKFTNHLPAQLFKAPDCYMLLTYKGNAFLFQLPVQFVGRAGNLFIRPHPVKAFHQNITEDCREGKAACQPGCDFKAGIAFQSA